MPSLGFQTLIQPAQGPLPRLLIHPDDNVLSVVEDAIQITTADAQ